MKAFLGQVVHVWYRSRYYAGIVTDVVASRKVAQGIVVDEAVSVTMLLPNTSPVNIDRLPYGNVDYPNETTPNHWKPIPRDTSDQVQVQAKGK